MAHVAFVSKRCALARRCSSWHLAHGIAIRASRARLLLLMTRELEGTAEALSPCLSP